MKNKITKEDKLYDGKEDDLVLNKPAAISFKGEPLGDGEAEKLVHPRCLKELLSDINSCLLQPQASRTVRISYVHVYYNLQELVDEYHDPVTGIKEDLLCTTCHEPITKLTFKLAE